MDLLVAAVLPVLSHSIFSSRGPTWDDQALTGMKFLLGADFKCLNPRNFAQTGHVLAVRALDGQQADTDMLLLRGHGGTVY